MFHEQSSYWHVILKVDFIRPDTRWLWNTPPNRVVMKWDWGKTKLESELMPAKRPCLHFIIIIMFNKQSFMLLGKRDNQRHRRGSIKQCFKPWIKTYLFKPSAGLFWLHMNAVNSWEHRGIAGHKRGAWVFREEFQAPPPFPSCQTSWLSGRNCLAPRRESASMQRDYHLMEWQDSDSAFSVSQGLENILIVCE